MKTFTYPGQRRLYQSWADMKYRCYNPNCRKYYLYGGRGITVCEEWRNSFKAFEEWAHDNGYADGLTLDRLNGHGDYRPENCCWSTYKEQNNNISTNRMVVINDVEMTLSEAAEFLDVPYRALQKKLNRLALMP